MPVQAFRRPKPASDIGIAAFERKTAEAARLLKLLANGQLNMGRMVTHRFGLDEFMTAYDVFTHSARTGALKVVLTPG